MDVPNISTGLLSLERPEPEPKPADRSTSSEADQNVDRVDISDEGRDMATRLVPEWARYHQIRNTLHDELHAHPALTPEHIDVILESINAGDFQTEEAIERMAGELVRDAMGAPVGMEELDADRSQEAAK